MKIEPSPRASVWRYLQAVLWSFFGIRRGSKASDDMASLRPLPLLVTGLVLAAAFVGALLTVVQIVTSGTAA